MSQFDRYDNPEIERECDWEVFIDKESPNIVNVRFGRYQEITIPPKFQWEEGQYIRFLDIDSEKIQECDFSVNGVIDSVIHYVNDGLVEIPNSLFTHHGNAKCFVKHVGEDNITVIRVISFLINRREKPQDYVSPDDEQTFRQWVQEQLDKGLIEDITEIPSTEDDGINIITITMKDGKEYVFTVKNGSKGETGQGIAEGGTTGQILAKKSDEDFDTEWVEIPTPVNVVQEEGQSTEDVMSQKAVSDSLESIREDKMDKDDSAVEDNIAIFDANGNVVDSGVNLDNIQIECDDHLDTESENPVQNKVLADIIPYKADYTYVNSKVDELNTSIGTKASTTYVDTELAKKANASDVETALSGKADVTDLPDSAELVPSFSITEAGKVLAVANDGESTTWATVESGSDLPDIQSGDAGKVLTVNQEEDGTEWAEVPKELPNVSSVDAGKVLQVSGVGQWVANEITTSSVVAFNGAGAPTSSIVAKVGDLYRDTTNDKLYQCSNYISPIGITDLTGLTVYFNSTLDFSVISGNADLSVNFSSNSYTTFSHFGYNATIGRMVWYSPEVVVYQSGAWTEEGYRTVAFTGGTDATNSTLITFVLHNATISGVGSTWIEVKASDDRIPTVTSADEGKILTVDSQGTWFAGNSSSESSTHTGHGVPIATIVAKVGDIYTDLDTNETYVCTNYVDPTVAITDLTGKTFYFNETLSEEDIIYIYEKYSETTGQGGYTFSSLQYINVDKNQNVQYDLSFRHNITSVDYYVLVSYTNGTLYETYNGGRWYNSNLRRIQFTGGTDATNQDLIDFVTSNAILDNTGSTWAKLVASPLTDTPTYNGSILQWNKSTNKWQANAGSIYFFPSSDNSGTYTRIDPGNGITVSSGYNIVAQYTADPRSVWYRINSSNHYLFRMLLKTLLLPADNGCQSFVNGSDMSNSMYYKAGQYGYVPATTAVNLVNCPTQEGFVLTVIWLNQSYYVLSNESNTKGVRFIITDSGKIYRQYVYNTSNTWYYGEEWKCITNGEVIPDAPTTDGNYVLKCTVSSGVPTYSWVLET